MSLLAGALLGISAMGALAHGVKTRTIEIIHPWTFGIDADGVVHVAMKIKNTGSRADRLVGARTNVANSATLFAATPVGVGQGQQVSSIDIASGGSVELQSVGQSILLSGFKRQLTAYDTFQLTLVFERAGRIAIEVLVEERSEPTPAR